MRDASSWRVVVATALTAIFVNEAAFGQAFETTLDTLSEAGDIPVTLDNFTRAASDIEFDKYAGLAGGVNRFYHFREPTPVDNQPTIRMNRDTLYSAGVVDISEGATLILPDAGERYMSAMIYNQDHYVNAVYHGGGTFPLVIESFDTPYVIVFVRTLVDASDPKDIEAVNALQDQMKIEASSSKPFVLPDYDEERYQALVKELNDLLPFVGGVTDTFGSRETVNPVRHLLGTGVGWGGLPDHEAQYPSVSPNLPVGEYRIDVPADVPVEAFWSISLYNAEGFFAPNDLGAYNINSVTGKRNDDGTMTVHLGGCDDGRVNCLPIMDGWNYVIRLYRPEEEVLNGNWHFPEAVALN